MIGRFPVINVKPVFDGGVFPAKVIVNEVFPVDAKVFREGHAKVWANVVIADVSGVQVASYLMKPIGYAADSNWHALVQAPATTGSYKFFIEAWSDDYHTWEHNAWIKIPDNQDVELTFAQGREIFDKWLKTEKLNAKQKDVLTKVVEFLSDTTLTDTDRLRAASSSLVHNVWNECPYRQLVSKSNEYPLEVERELSSFAAWYQFFPRSEGAKIGRDGVLKSGTLTTATKRLDAVKEMGFDIIYLPPIHPIGHTFRKGANNSLVAGPADPGSPWAIGNQDGGHDSVSSEIGTLTTFKNFVKKAKELKLEVALDIALQCSPDHPWIKEHPEWFTLRPDGTIAYAENPPKKYQDIYPINFDNQPDEIVTEILRILRLWISAGVTIFRVDNPHTKPVWFWEYVIADIKQTNPEVIWLAEAFTAPAMMKTLGLIGYQQSHSYFLWRNTRHELSEFLSQISGDDAFWYRASLWPTTPDNLTDYLASSGVAGHAIRAVLAAMGSPSWGIYAGYELVENQQRFNPDGTRIAEHVNSEKYEIKVRNWKDVEKYGISHLISALNKIRHKHISCRNIHSLQIQYTNNENILAFSRHISGEFTSDKKDDTLIVVVNLDPHNAQQGTISLDFGALNLPEYYYARDELTGREFNCGHSIYVDLAPVVDVGHILHIQH